MIYKTTNLINGKEYIGKHQTKTIEDGYLGSGKNLKRAIKKYGYENFKREILFTFQSESDMVAKEIELVTEDYCARKDTYNICPGGQGGFGYINKNGLFYQTPEIRRQQADKLRGRKNTRLSEMNKLRWAKGKLTPPTFTGRKHTDETKRKMSLSNSGKFGVQNSQHGTCWITDGVSNKKCKKEDLPFWETQGFTKGRV